METSCLKPSSNRPRQRVSMVVPTLNEARDLPHIFSRLPGDILQVIVADGHFSRPHESGSRPATADVGWCSRLARGKGNALACGFEPATGDVIVRVDADGSADPSEIPKLVHTLLNGADFAKGRRLATLGSSSDMTRLRKLVTTCWVQCATSATKRAAQTPAAASSCSGRSTFQYWTSSSPLPLHSGATGGCGATASRSRR
jgi:hypothetical protein